MMAWGARATLYLQGARSDRDELVTEYHPPLCPHCEQVPLREIARTPCPFWEMNPTTPIRCS